jgi:hypothetical protein
LTPYEPVNLPPPQPLEVLNKLLALLGVRSFIDFLLLLLALSMVAAVADALLRLFDRMR